MEARSAGPHPKGWNEGDKAFRPLCMIDTAGKLYEHVLVARLKRELESQEGLAEFPVRLQARTISGNCSESTGPHCTWSIERLAHQPEVVRPCDF
ncbi:hypothetical protein HHI36_005207 [Cryptolaemus montrouzieri]|uniref:Uncharacterized protein n=1 Tax=Cryptolaemus montrouzieri TaxID=559131 RepID=A0ABD2NTQ6_9CUCU